MPTLRLVPDPPGDPDEIAHDAVPPPPTAEERDGLPVRWFDCADPVVGAAVRAHVLAALNTWAVDSDTMADAMVLVSELVTNVRDHTASDALGVRVRVTADRISVAVIERAASSAPVDGRLQLAAPEESPLQDRGRGLQILDSMASEWGFVRRAGVTTTWFALPAAPPATPARPPEIRRF